ncbi:hypothetical protein CCR85_07425 [Rhodothalassium salexigens]|uniref:uroporphyrinogen-III synthase n=1 Tax=Rhodothalassium salexigens TaxID=1086 RepID=UPI0019146139|nr:hypothetical protein [Rhodothalassium salexigens]
MTTLLLTRPAALGAKTADRLTAAGARVLSSPAMTIEACGPERVPVGDAQAVLITSIHGAQLGLPRLAGPGRPVWAVGPATGEAVAATARADGPPPSAIHCAEGDAVSLSGQLIARLDPADGPLLYLAGAVRKPTLEARLAEAGFDVRTVDVYDAHAAEALTAEARTALAEGRVDAVLLYSPRTARIVRDLADRAGVAAALKGVTAVCISPAVADEVAGRVGRIATADSPDEPSLLSALRDAVGLAL